MSPSLPIFPIARKVQHRAVLWVDLIPLPPSPSPPPLPPKRWTTLGESRVLPPSSEGCAHPPASTYRFSFPTASSARSPPRRHEEAFPAMNPVSPTRLLCKLVNFDIWNIADRLSNVWLPDDQLQKKDVDSIWLALPSFIEKHVHLDKTILEKMAGSNSCS